MEDKMFRFVNGTIAKDLKELKEGISLLSDREFHEHVNGFKNDFANWIRDVLGEEELASIVYLKKSKEEIVEVIDKWLTKPKELRKKEKEVKEASEHIQHEMIIKEFFYGLLFGVILGFIIAKIIIAIG